MGRRRTIKRTKQNKEEPPRTTYHGLHHWYRNLFEHLDGIGAQKGVPRQDPCVQERHSPSEGGNHDCKEGIEGAGQAARLGHFIRRRGDVGAPREAFFLGATTHQTNHPCSIQHRRGLRIQGRQNAGNDQGTLYIACSETDMANVVKGIRIEPLYEVLEAVFRAGRNQREVRLCEVAGNDEFGVAAHAGQKHEHLGGRGILHFIGNDECLMKGASAHEPQRDDVNDAGFHHGIELYFGKVHLEDIKEGVCPGLHFFVDGAG